MTDIVGDAADQLKDLKVGGAEEAGEKTVLHSATDFSVVHPLAREWTLWYTKPPSGAPNENWADLIKELVTVKTVEEFWGAYNAIPKVSELPRKADYALFRKGVRPEWEDPANAKGGKWIYVHKIVRAPEGIDDKYLNVLLGLIGGSLDNQDPAEQQVNGAVAMVRSGQVKIALWVIDSHEKSHDVALRFKDLLDLPSSSTVEYNLHDTRRDKKGRSAPTV